MPLINDPREDLNKAFLSMGKQDQFQQIFYRGLKPAGEETVVFAPARHEGAIAFLAALYEGLVNRLIA